MAFSLFGIGKNNSDNTKNKVVEVKIDQIIPNRYQPRKVFDENALQELADSIREHGLLQPLLVRPIPEGGYQIVAGERRWRASRMAGLTNVPVIIREFDDQKTMELALIENLQRENLNAMEEAAGYMFATLDEIKGFAQQGIFLHYDSIKEAFEI